MVSEVKTKIVPFIDDAEAIELKAAARSAEAGDSAAIDVLRPQLASTATFSSTTADTPAGTTAAAIFEALI